ncbi:uncharacterized protein METZ01_LOCUS43730, partial [marine metagenome]
VTAERFLGNPDAVCRSGTSIASKLGKASPKDE